MDSNTTRRAFLAGSISGLAGLAGCAAVARDEDVQVSIEAAEAYRVEPARLVARVVLTKPAGTEAQVHLRWEVADQEYTQATELTVVIEKELTRKSVGMILESATDVDTENVTRSEVQIGDGAPRTEWTAAPFNGSD